MIPGRTLHRLAARICTTKTLERVVEPAIADFQKEYADARLHSPLTRARILLSGYAGVWEGIAMTALEVSPRVEDDRRALLRTLISASVVTICASGLLIAFTISAVPVFAPFYIALLIPMTLPIALPLGLTLGMAFGFGCGGLSPYARRIVLVTALLVSSISFGSMAYVKPVANQSFRQSVYNAIGGRGIVQKGLHEMSLTELQREMPMAPRGDAAEMPERAEWIYHLTLALPLAPLVLAALALLLISRGTHRAIVMALSVAYYVVAFVMEALVYQGLPPLAGAWLPNVIFAAAAALIGFSGSSRFRDFVRPA